LPVVEFHGEWSLGYNGTDIFSPERDYTVGTEELPRYLDEVNVHLSKHGCAPMTLDELDGQVAQLKVFVDICHLYGLAVLFDVVYNHAGGDLDAQSLDYFDFPATRDKTSSIYFSDQDWAGGRVFDFGRPEVREFLIGNAELLLSEYHADGLRFDEVTVIDMFGGRPFCQELTQTLHQRYPDRLLIAEYWGNQRELAVQPPPAGMGFDLGYADGLRDGVRTTLLVAEAGADAQLPVGQLAGGLLPPPNLGPAQAYNCVENHDLVLDADGDHRHPRIPRLADAADSRSWYARSRSRVATAALMTGSGTPMLFMGQELLEDKLWSDDFHRVDRLLWWGGLDTGDRSVTDFHRFVRDLIGVRRRFPALRSDGSAVPLVDEDNRVVVLHRWMPREGRDVIVVISLNERTIWDAAYSVGMPCPGTWYEVFNSDYYDHFPNPDVAGNAGSVRADGPGMHGFAQSASLTVPANAVLMLSQDPAR
jgi:1,4-alpha-glucan branching enzyme